MGDRKPPGDYVVAYTTVGDKEQALALAHKLVSERLAACVQVQEITSVYRWKGAVEQSGEYLLTIKTAQERVQALTALVQSDHPYEVPELVVVPVLAGYQPYLEWISESTLAGNSS